jgi:hypothetical protein
MPGGGYGYGGRPQCRDCFSLFSWRNLKRARLLPAFISILILIPISLSLSMPARMLLLSLTAIATVAISRVFGLEVECAVASVQYRTAPVRPTPTFYCSTALCPASAITRQGKARHVPNGQVRLLYSSLYKHCMVCGKRQLFFRQQRSRVGEQQPGWQWLRL